MKTSEMRSKTVDELREELRALLREQFNLRMQRGAGQPPRPHLFKRVRHSIARVKTVMSEMTSEQP